MPSSPFTDADIRRLQSLGIPVEEGLRQLEMLRRPPTYADLVRPSRVDDGVVKIARDEVHELQKLHEEAARAGRWIKFVPASGAASRMFKELLFFLRGAGREASAEAIERDAAAGKKEAAALESFLTGLRRFAFRDDLAKLMHFRGLNLESLAETGEFHPLLRALLEPDGLGYETLPKGLLKFHDYPDGARTPFEEHLVEAAHYVRDADGVCRLHLTVSPDHRTWFAERLDSVREAFEEQYGVRFDVQYSAQKPSTDTLATDLDHQPIRDVDGQLLLRPGGHGALIENLDDLRGDLVFVKNIDNIQPDHLRDVTIDWKRTLAGYLLKLQREIFAHLGHLRSPEPVNDRVDDALRFVKRDLNVEIENEDRIGDPRLRRAFLIDRLERPLRVCGVVPNTGEPGGGPFWVRDKDGTIRSQIVETVQVDPADEAQQRILKSSTHFNPVDLVCAVRDSAGKPFDLHAFIDPDSALVTRKSAGGRELKALERPGLWNGAMAAWNTVFVEVPLETFSPVKSVLDLLRPEHQPG